MQGLAGDIALTIRDAALVQAGPVIVKAAGAKGDVIDGAGAGVLAGAAGDQVDDRAVAAIEPGTW